MNVEQTDAAAWTVAPDHQIGVGGARAVALFVAVVWNSRLPLLPWKIPGMPWMLDRIYELIARNRTRLPGETPWCIVHDDSCHPSSG